MVRDTIPEGFLALMDKFSINILFLPRGERALACESIDLNNLDKSRNRRRSKPSMARSTFSSNSMQINSRHSFVTPNQKFIVLFESRFNATNTVNQYFRQMKRWICDHFTIIKTDAVESYQLKMAKTLGKYCMNHEAKRFANKVMMPIRYI
jgi:hypothetical protein